MKKEKLLTKQELLKLLKPYKEKRIYIPELDRYIVITPNFVKYSDEAWEEALKDPRFRNYPPEKQMLEIAQRVALKSLIQPKITWKEFKEGSDTALGIILEAITRERMKEAEGLKHFLEVQDLKEK